METVTVNLGAASYPIYIGPGTLSMVGEAAAGLKSRRALVVTDEHVGPVFAGQVEASLRAAGFTVREALIAPGETAKSFAMAERLYTQAIEAGLDRHSPIIAVGGGVVGDLTGFVAATYLRGVPFIQIPTSLLAQVDSSVGGKVAVNHPLGKNLIGAFYQPRFVIIDTNTLITLPDRELSTGLAELVKHGIIADKRLFADLALQSERLLNRDAELLTEFISRSCRIKAHVVEQDERESGLRMILNFGHTIGHAIEAASDFAYTHGEAVAIGMHGAACISRSMGLCSEEDRETICRLLTAFRLPISAPGLKVAELADWLTRDKKSFEGHIHWVLLKGIGQTVVSNQVPAEVVEQALRQVTVDQG